VKICRSLKCGSGLSSFQESWLSIWSDSLTTVLNWRTLLISTRRSKLIQNTWLWIIRNTRPTNRSRKSSTMFTGFTQSSCTRGTLRPKDITTPLSKTKTISFGTSMTMMSSAKLESTLRVSRNPLRMLTFSFTRNSTWKIWFNKGLVKVDLWVCQFSNAWVGLV